MKHLLFILFSGTVAIGFAQDSISVLFVGNSYIYSNDLPGMLSALTGSLGDEITYDSKVNGGFTFNNQLNDPQTHVKIKSKPWDFVVLQGQSQEPSFPYLQVNTNTLPPAVKLADSVYANRYCSQVLYFMTWGRENGDQQWDSINTFHKMNDRLELAYLRIMDSAQASVSPVGSAWRFIRDNHPTIQLYSADGSHPSVAGTYLAACTFYTSLFRKSPVGDVYSAGLDPAVANVLQTTAASIVLDNLGQWKLRPTEEIAIASFDFIEEAGEVQFVNTSWRASDYFWDFGDGETSMEESPIHIYAAAGNYSTTLTATNECGAHVTTSDIAITVVGLDEVQNSIALRQLGTALYNISFKNSPTELTFTNSIGQSLDLKSLVLEKSGMSYTLDLSCLSGGIYFLTVKNEGKMKQFKLVR
jgi:PKD repeat protein